MNCNMMQQLVVAFFLAFAVKVEGDLTTVLNHYETLHHHHFKHRVVKRSTDDEFAQIRQVEFDSLGRHFHLYLRQRTRVIGHGFRVVAVDKNNVENAVKLNLNNFYHGYDLEEPSTSRVSAFWEDSTTMTASIQTANDTFLIEPAWRHLPQSSNYTMIAYKKSDIRLEEDMGKKFCGYVKEEMNEETRRYMDEKGHQEQEKADGDAGPPPSKRVRRQSSKTYNPVKENTCPLYLVADHRFHENMGQNSLYRTTTYLLGLIDRVDDIYRNTNFGQGYTGMGFEVKEIKIHEYPTVVANTSVHYNMHRNDETNPWQTKELLEAFSEEVQSAHFCLSHLFTAISFPHGTLGLSYVASNFYGDPGGICSRQVYYKGSRQLYLNTGWSSSLNRHNRRLLTEEAFLVTTHEFGHNWGSEHDPDTSECSPDAFHGGKYIMYTYSVSGYDTNNKVFSNCSKRSIATVLHSKSKTCFQEESGSFCGNFRIDKDEECDAGPDGGEGRDQCCNEDCKLRPGKKCSDTNHDCCKNCDYAAADTQCHEGLQGSCEGAANCTGYNEHCPPPTIIDDDTPCLYRGKCRHGRCLSFCETHNKLSCVCDSVENSCKWCCRDNMYSPCVPFTGDVVVEFLPLPDGMPCIQGTCEEGVCVKQVQDLIERLWDVIENITPDKFVEFMRANIVGTVIIFSLVIWIPVSCVISHLDRKRKKEEEKDRNWHKYDNTALILDKDRNRGLSVRQAGIRTRRLQKNPAPVDGYNPEHRVAAPAKRLFIPPPGGNSAYRQDLGQSVPVKTTFI